MYEESAEEREVNAVKLCENYRKVYSWKAECERFKGLIEKVVENGMFNDFIFALILGAGDISLTYCIWKYRNLV